MDPLALASAAVAALAPYLATAGQAAAKKLGEKSVEAGEKLLVWMRERLSGRGQEALDDLAANPTSEENQVDLRKQLAKALEANPDLAAELKALVSAAAGDGDVMTQTVSGAGAKVAQVKGSGNTTSIS